MKGILLKLYMHENRKHGHTLLYEWLIEEAKKLGISGGSVFRGIAGFGRNGILHEQHFLELAGEVPLAIEFLVNDVDAEKLLKRLTMEKISIAYAKIPSVIGSIEGND